MKRRIRLKINGEQHEIEIKTSSTLLSLLRDELGLKGTKEGCGAGTCGACSVIIDGKVIDSCIFPAMDADGKEVLTVEGLAGENGKLHPLQEAFMEEGAVQCGFCTPGMLMSAKALLDENPRASEEDIKTGMAGNLCRCTGYVRIIKAVQNAAKKMQQVK
jgi:carbon-monoxide dehydrogenase small subunit